MEFAEFSFQPMLLDAALAGSWLVAQILLGVLFADLMSGVVHWYIDTYGDSRTPILGKWVHAPNINHHAHPLDCTRSGFWSRNGPVLSLTALFAIGFFLAGWINPFTTSALIAGGMANEIHIWTHKPKRRRPALVRFGQRTGFLLSAKEHWRHHSGRYDTRYCTVTNLLNPALDGLRIFRIVEGAVEGFGRLRPRDEILRIGAAGAGFRRRALSRARRFVAATGWRTRRALSAPIMA